MQTKYTKQAILLLEDPDKAQDPVQGDKLFDYGKSQPWSEYHHEGTRAVREAIQIAVKNLDSKGPDVYVQLEGMVAPIDVSAAIIRARETTERIAKSGSSQIESPEKEFHRQIAQQISRALSDVENLGKDARATSHRNRLATENSHGRARGYSGPTFGA